MSLILGFVPWYVWIGLIALVAFVALVPGALTIFLGLLKTARAAWAILPDRVKLAIVGLIALGALYVLHCWDVRYEVGEAVKEEQAAGKLRLTALRDAFQKQMQDARDAAQAKFDALGAQLVAQQLHREEEAKTAEAKRVADLAALKKGFSSYVTPLQLSRCTDVPRGLLLFGADAATYANGGADAAPVAPAPGSAVDAPSGVSVPALADAIADQAGAYRACKNRVAEWQQWGADVDVYVAKVKAILSPKGTP